MSSYEQAPSRQTDTRATQRLVPVAEPKSTPSKVLTPERALHLQRVVGNATMAPLLNGANGMERRSPAPTPSGAAVLAHVEQQRASMGRPADATDQASPATPGPAVAQRSMGGGCGCASPAACSCPTQDEDETVQRAPLTPVVQRAYSSPEVEELLTKTPNADVPGKLTPTPRWLGKITWDERRQLIEACLCRC